MKDMFIEVNTQFEFIHCWPDAPEEVGFLRNPHRHDFFVTCTIEVNHNNREIEFFILLHSVEKFINETLKKMPISTSCEQFCEKLGEFLHKTYGDRKIRVKVSEDNKSSSIIEWE